MAEYKKIILDSDLINYFLLIGKAGGQIAHGGTGANDDLEFRTTSHATKGNYLFPDLTSDGLVSISDGRLGVNTDTFLTEALGDARYLMLDCTNDPLTGQLNIDNAVEDYALKITNATRTPKGIYVDLESFSPGDIFTGSVSGFPAFNVAGTGLITSSSGIRTATGSASAPAYAFTSDTGTGMYRIGSNTLGFSTGGTKRVEIDSAGNLRLVNKLSINYDGTIDTGVQIHLKGGALDNANIRMDGNTAGFFYFGFNDAENRAALSVSDGTTTTWDALGIDATGKVQIGYGLGSFNAQLDVYRDSSNPTTRFRNAGIGDITRWTSGSDQVMAVERYGKVTHTPNHTSARSVYWANHAMLGTFGYDDAHYYSAGSGTQYIWFSFPIYKNMGGAVRIKKITVRARTMHTSSYINNSWLQRTNANGTVTNVITDTTNHGEGTNGNADYVIYDSTGVTLTDAPHHIVFEIVNAASEGVRIRAVKFEYDLV